MESPVLEIKSISKSFLLSSRQRRELNTVANSIVAVDDLSFSLQGGEIYGLLGPNGAGKTTTLRMVASLIKPNKGEILYRGEDIQKDIFAYRKRIAFLTSELKLDDFFTPDYIFTYFSSLYGMEKKGIEERKKTLFRQFGIDKYSYTPIKNLSTGMKQKVSLAISLCHDPEIIVFDEPTNGLDIIASRDVENYLVKLRDEGKAIIISSHIFSLVEKLADRCGIIDKGKLIIDQRMDELTKEMSLEDRFFSLVREVDR